LIQNAITYSEQAAKVVAAYSSLALKDPNQWDLKENDFIREEIKRYYVSAQGSLCCYCGKPYPADSLRYWDGEHILPKSLYPEFLFEPVNLAVACPICNSWKSHKDILVGKRGKKYPKNSAKFSIVHPHFDELWEHVSLYLGFIYSPKTPKGAKTIDMCYLGRFAVELAGWDDRFRLDERFMIAARTVLESKDEAKINAAVASLLLIGQVQLSRSLLDNRKSAEFGDDLQETAD